MDEKDEVTLSMDETASPELVDKPTIDHAMKDEPQPEVQAEGEEKPERLRGPDGKFASKDQGDKPAEEAASAPPAQEEPNVPVKALQEERRKRQELEQQVAAMQAQFAQQQPQTPTPEFWDDPQGFMAKQLEQHTEQVIQRFQEQQAMERINASETAAKGKYADYDDAFHAFRQAASASPALVQQMKASPDPAEFAYRTGKRSMDLEKVGSIDELLKAERAKWEAEVKAAMPRQAFPTSTVTDGSVASRGGPVWSGPTQDRDILPMG
jgi:hypothetical protein